MIGIYLFKFSEKDPRICETLTVNDTGLDIGDASISVLYSYDAVLKAHLKELVITYKTIFINTYNIWVYDISGPA